MDAVARRAHDVVRTTVEARAAEQRPPAVAATRTHGLTLLPIARRTHFRRGEMGNWASWAWLHGEVGQSPLRGLITPFILL